MGKFILKRIGQLILSLFIASILVFIFVRLSDTDPVAVILGGKQTSQETIQAIKEKFNLDKPLFQQYLLWIDGLFHGDLGLSFKYQTSINELKVAVQNISIAVKCKYSAHLVPPLPENRQISRPRCKPSV